MATVDQLPILYKEGDKISYPGGIVYQRINGNWVLIEHPQGVPKK